LSVHEELVHITVEVNGRSDAQNKVVASLH